MKVAVFSTKVYDRQFLEAVNSQYGHELTFFEPHLDTQTTILASGCPAVCVFVNDSLNGQVLEKLAQQGTSLIALRCAGFNNVDVTKATELDMTVVRVPAYSPYAIAEHTIGLMLALNRKIHRAYSRVREGNFSLDGLLGFDMHGRTVGIVGTGKIGVVVAQILNGMGCQLVAYDPYPNPDCQALGVKYVELAELFAISDIVTLHCPLTPENYHLINSEALEQMKPGVMLINTSRGGLIDTKAIIGGLKSKKIGYLAMDVYEQESALFFEDLSNEVIQDDIFQRLLTFPNVIITAHQAFLTENALHNIAETTLSNITNFEKGLPCQNKIIINRK
ncbi:2-hydroxyacid dehydrogenase [Moorena producens JHB]|uniref:2-hydroxyacid dehydrogenase n=1 Tax=Moorena producens (strain JHB) TaxID=1454205 RepID=A0A1D9G6B9_MOOP1|nr:2-hydroxyacid dehydrogenase [Moorena producens]AOY83192.1 2-hydroxyacid dehydrogenase [Moorena producens JHB]